MVNDSNQTSIQSADTEVLKEGAASLAWPLRIDQKGDFWTLVSKNITNWQQACNIVTTELTIVVPFVQLIAPLRASWGKALGKELSSGFLPRIETTQTWSARIGGVHIAGQGPTADPVLDHLQAKEWLERLSQTQALDLADALVEPLIEMALELMYAAGSINPAKRDAYWEKAQSITQNIPPGVAGVEAALGPLAVAWAQATEKWQTDVLFAAAQQSQTLLQKQSTPSTQRKGLVIIQAGGSDLLTKHLFDDWAQDLRLWVDLDSLQNPFTHAQTIAPADPLSVIAGEHRPQWQRAKDAEDEAERAAAQIISLLNAGVAPIALCSQDRPIARRVWALLNRYNLAQPQVIPMADETGWTLSTTRSAALAMRMAMAAVSGADSNTILGAFKALPNDTPFIDGLDDLEKHLRLAGSNEWPLEASEKWTAKAQTLLVKINQVLMALGNSKGEASRTLLEHLQAFDVALKKTMAWSALQADEAGREVLQMLHMHEIHELPADVDDTDVQFPVSAFIQKAQSTQMSYLEFTQWMSRTLESVTFIPPAPPNPQVVLTPLARVMLRPFAAVVIPGCDESRLTAPPSLPGFWTEAERMELGLMHRELWWQRLQAQWVQALRLPYVSLLWRMVEGSQPLGAASLVQRVVDTLDVTHAELEEQRLAQPLTPEPVFVPAPQPAGRLKGRQLSASAYNTLRGCPYRFYAGYLLRVREYDELDTELTRRDYGNWLHMVLKQFHTQRAATGKNSETADADLLEKCAHDAAQELDPARLIPWQARWPALKASYLRWLKKHEEEGGSFQRAEFAMHHALSEQVTLQGRIDRLDQKDQIPIFIDYKTERRSYTEARVKEAYEDVQLPFYALLAQGHIDNEPDTYIAHTECAQAMYLSLDDREDVAKAIHLDALQEVKPLLAQSIIKDMDRINQGFSLYPIGQAHICDYCDVKGLCRKGYWVDPYDAALDAADVGVSPSSKKVEGQP